MRDRETVRVREREIESRREDGKEEKADIRFFTSFYFPSFLQLSFPFISYVLFCLFYLHYFSYLHSSFPPFPLSPLLFSSPLLPVSVMSRSWGESTWDFPTARQDQTQPHTHSFSVPPSTPSVSCQRGVLRKTTHIPPPSILDVCWNFMPLVVPQTSTVCCYGDRIIRRRL